MGSNWSVEFERGAEKDLGIARTITCWLPSGWTLTFPDQSGYGMAVAVQTLILMGLGVSASLGTMLSRVISWAARRLRREQHAR